MIYSIFMRKIKDDVDPFPTTLVVQEYINRFINETDIVIAFPGYMSTTSATINNFITNIKFPKNTYFAEGMNGNRLLSSGINIQDEHNSYFSLNLSGLSYHKQDHAKMMFFFDNDKKIVDLDISQLLQMNVKAVLLGSSNQSKTTYFNAIADKGEADIFLFNCSFMTDKIENEDIAAKEFFNVIFNNNVEYKEATTLFKEIVQPSTSLNKMFKDAIR